MDSDAGQNDQIGGSSDWDGVVVPRRRKIALEHRFRLTGAPLTRRHPRGDQSGIFSRDCDFIGNHSASGGVFINGIAGSYSSEPVETRATTSVPIPSAANEMGIGFRAFFPSARGSVPAPFLGTPHWQSRLASRGTAQSLPVAVRMPPGERRHLGEQVADVRGFVVAGKFAEQRSHVDCDSFGIAPRRIVAQ